jgi:hypothetical protein
MKTSYSRRELYEFGELLGDSVTRKEGGRIIYGGGGDSGGGGGAPAMQTQVVDLPDWAKPTGQKALAGAEALTFQKDAQGNVTGFQPYQAYGGERTAQFTPLQKQAFQGVGNLQTAPQLGTATNLAGAAAFGALGAGSRFDPYQTGQFGAQAGQYMDPYMQNVVDIQQREAQRQADITGTQRGAQAAQSGAFGGSRQAIMDAEAARNLSMQKGDIQARGLQDAYSRGQTQFNTEQQLREQSRQYGAGLGLQGMQTALQGAGQLGQLGQQQFGQQKDILGMQNQFGSQQQQQVQNILSQQYQDFLNQKKHPYQQLEFMSNILRGTPMGTVQSMYAQQPSALQNIGSLGMGAYGLSQLMKAEGGTVSSYADGGSVDSSQNIEAIVEKLSDPQLKQAAEAAQARGDVEQLQIIQQEMASRASERNGMMGAFNQLPQEQQQQMMAGGGMVAFAGDEDENDGETGQMVSEPRIPVGRGDLPTYGAAMRGLTDLYSRFQGDKGFTPLTPEEEKSMYDRSVGRGKEIYGDVFSKIKADIESQRGESAESLRESRGMAALQAAAGMLKGRGVVQGLANAGGAFGESYGKALRADKEQKRALSSMDLNLAKAEADQRMGLHDKAEARVAKANADRRAAHTAGVNKTKAEADLLYKMGRVSMPPAPTKTGTGAPKLSPDERIAAKAELIALGKDKFMGQSGPEASAAYLESIGKSAAARTGSRYTGPDKTFDRQVKLQQLYANDPQLKAFAESLAMAQLSGNQQRIKTLQDSITARESALAKNLPEVPTAGGKPAPAGGQPAPAARTTPEEFNKQWASLKPGQTLVGPDGVTYKKQPTQ